MDAAAMSHDKIDRNRLRLDVQDAIHNLSVATCDALETGLLVEGLEVAFEEKDGAHIITSRVIFKHNVLEERERAAKQQQIRSRAMAMLRELTNQFPSLTFKRLIVSGGENHIVLIADLEA